jgi:hypothetical protein
MMDLSAAAPGTAAAWYAAPKGRRGGRGEFGLCTLGGWRHAARIGARVASGGGGLQAVEVVVPAAADAARDSNGKAHRLMTRVPQFVSTRLSESAV